MSGRTSVEPALDHASVADAGGVSRFFSVESSERIVLGASGALAAAAEVVAWSTKTEQSPLVVALALGSIAIGGRTTLRQGLGALRARTLDINLLMSIAVTGAVLIGQWPEAAMVTFLFAVAEAIEGHALDRARGAIRALMQLSPDVATVRVAGGPWRTIPAVEVAVDDLMRVLPGDRVPLDGVVKTGRSAVNQAPITGESLPIDKGPGDPVFAGTINEHGPLEILVTASAGHTTLDRIIQAVEGAQARRAPTERFIDSFARIYTPVVVVVAAGTAVIPPLLHWASPYDAVYRALVLLVVACPCALVLSTPITVVSGLTHAARRGILVKGGVYLEEARRTCVVAFDKTGTLTRGSPVVTDVEPLDGLNAAEALRILASLNSHSTHPVARATVEAWQRLPGRGDLLPVADMRALPGRGIVGTISGTDYLVGNHRLAEERASCSAAANAILGRLEREGKTTVVLAAAGEAIAVFGVSDELRPTSIEAVAALHSQGVRTVMLTGDNEVTARAIAERVGIDDVRANLLPEDKLAAIEAMLTQCKHVAMVGDGVNDAPALARASIGIAMGAAGSDTALETADVAFMEDDLRRLPEFLDLSRRVGRILVQNIVVSIGVKAVFLAMTLSGAATLWMAVFADMGTSLLVVANSLRVLGRRRVEAAVEAAGDRTVPG